MKKKRRLGDMLMNGVHELEAILKAGKRPQDVLTVRTVELVEPRKFTARQLRNVRKNELRMSAAVFAAAMGVSKKLVEHWEAGRRVPSPMACRLLDALRRDPSAAVQWRVKKSAA